MARGKRKKKKTTVRAEFKFELYGILMLIFSAIALFRAGSVGRSLTILFRFTAGVLDWVIPLIAIYIAFFIMINRKWPRKWTPKKSGVLLLLIGFILIMEISFINTLAASRSSIGPSFIWHTTWDRLTQGLSLYPAAGDILTRGVGGGIIGAVLYSALDQLFSYEGTVLVVIALFAIGIMLVTGISFVEIGKRIRASLKAFNVGMKNRLLDWFGAGGTKRRSTARGTKGRTALKEINTEPMHSQQDEEDEDDEDDVMAKKPAASSFFNRKKQRGPIVDVAPEPLPPLEVYAAVDTTSAIPLVTAPEGDAIPVVRDFQDHRDAFEEAVPFPASGNGMNGNGHSVGSGAKTKSSAVGTDPSGDNAPDVELSLNPEKVPPKPYIIPSFQLLNRPVSPGKGGGADDYKANARKLEATLESFGVRAKVLEVVRGPAVTRYEIQPDTGVKVSRIVSLTDDIALALAAKDIRMEAPIPGKAAIGIEVPNSEVSVVTLREVMESTPFQESQAKLTIVLGRDISGQPIVGNLARMPHLLVAGATGSGKSVCINGIITSILFKAKPDEVKFLMIDPKMVELNVYNGIPHLLAPVVTDPRRASLALKKIVVEMEKRYELFSKSGTRNIEGYNAMLTDANNPNPGTPLPLIVVIVDELADLMMVAAGDVEDSICRLAQMARAAGIHLIIATQRPSVDVITGVIKANIPSRIAFGVSSQVDSRTILDMAGAEKLLGRGDMLFHPVGASKPTRVQGAFLSDQEVEAVVGYVSNQGKAGYQEDFVPQVEESTEGEDIFEDELYDQAVQIVVEAKQASVSLLQRRMRVGYTRAARLIDSMEAKGVVGPYEGSKPREVLISPEQYQMSRMSS
ncbi:FtsK/SpoIIIE family DNA translocase [Gorillibacterium massiliense]|uniref:FtsK/SpoIIIE family DNA translocase n=1 Tax=Gorillibacterium massiliense TaxID=1280390 RepID=UPI0004B51046|nr:DNA translocase FtsK [Gorillibacterium massiliense]